MKKFSSLLFASVLLTPLMASAQSYYEQEGYQPPQLEQMVAPIALYPDALLTPVLVASNYPQQIRDALGWLGNPYLAQTPPDQVSLQLQQMPWDDSVKFLTAFPQVLQRMNDNPSWEQQMGSAYAQQPYDVMDAVQNLRHDAEEAGVLRSNAQASVYQQGNDILIQPTNPNMIYVPAYDPARAYGEWVEPQYPPYAFVVERHREQLYVPSFLSFSFVSNHWHPHPMAWQSREHVDHAFHTSYPAPEVHHDAPHVDAHHFDAPRHHEDHPAPVHEAPAAAPQVQQHFEEAPRSPGLAHPQPQQQAAPVHNAPPAAAPEHHEEPHHEEPHHDEPPHNDGHDEHHP